MPTQAVIKEALRQWVELSIASTDAANRTIFGNQGSPRPERPYLTITIDGIDSVGRDERRATDNTGDRTVVGTRIADVSVQSFGTDAIEIAETARSGLWLNDVLGMLRDNDVVFIDSDPVQNISLALEGEYEERAQFTARFSFVSSQSESPGWIESIEADATVGAVTGTVITLNRPLNALATASYETVTVSWDAVTNADRYNIYWGTSAGITTSSTAIYNVTSPYTHSSRTQGATYYYAIEAVAEGTASQLSDEVNDTCLTLGVPSGVAAAAISTGVSISWTSVAGATSYNIYWATSSGVTTSDTKITGATSPHSHTGLTRGTTYYYKVEAAIGAIVSALSSEVNGAPSFGFDTGFSTGFGS